LPRIAELRLVSRLVVGGVEVMHARFEARIHDRKILIRQGQIDDDLRLDLFDQRRHLTGVVGINLRCGDRSGALPLDGLTLREGP
jgi:hypothetical protein